MLTPMVIRQKLKARQISAISNLRAIGISLFEFKREYGKFPDSETAAAIKRKLGSPLTLADRTSNDVFVQLIASEICWTEIIFATHTKATKKPDNDWFSDATALESGETGFAFLSQLSKNDNPSTPVVLGPMIPSKQIVDAEAFEQRSVFLKLDNSVSAGPINHAGKIVIRDSDILDPKHPLWNGKAPDVKWPK